MKLHLLYVSANGFPRSETDSRGAFSLEHAKALQAEGATVFAVDTGAPDFGEDVLDGVRIWRIPRLRPILKSGSLTRLVAYLRAFRRIRRMDYNCAIFSFFYLKYLPLVPFLRKPGVKVVVIAHGGDVMPTGYLGRILKRRLFQMVDLVTPVSEYTATLLSCLLRRRNADNAKIITISNGVDEMKLKPLHSAEEMRSRLRIPSEVFVILSVCNLVRRKGIDIVIRAVGSLLADCRKVRHIIIGAGPEGDRLMALAEATGRGENFLFLPRVASDELADYYAMADLFAMVSITDWERGQTEGFGVTYAEAMALGTPVIGGGGSGTTTPVKHGFTGLLVDPHAPTIDDDVTRAITRFMDDPAYHKRVSADAVWFVGEHLSWRTNAKATLAAIERLHCPTRRGRGESAAAS